MEEKELLEQITAYVEAHTEEMIEDAKTLISINSEKMEAKPGKPYGEGTAEVFEAAEKILTGHGMKVKNYDNYVLTADMNEGEASLDILAHLDVVPATEGFTVTEPFCPVVKDGALYGRGSADDKGPAMTALYAMRAIKELGIPVTKNCRLILGADEECGSSDIRYYYSIEKEAPMTFSPDADFPLINIEKGGLHLDLQATVDPAEAGEVRLVSANSGVKINVVPAKAYAVIAGADPAILEKAKEATKQATGVTITETKEADGVHFLVEGLAAHAASPSLGNNALTAMFHFLHQIPFSDKKVNQIIANLCRLYPHGDWNGKALGVNHADEESGELTLSLNIMTFDGTTLTAHFDCRAPLCANDENTTAVILKKYEEAGFTSQGGKMFEPHVVSADSPFVQTLLSCYETVTGRKEKPLAIGGGTYVHHIANGVAFGCADPAVDNHMHGDDEFMTIDQMKKSAIIFALAIAKLCK
jgi:succinyl-diaminopimelate desuccinylase